VEDFGAQYSRGSRTDGYKTKEKTSAGKMEALVVVHPELLEALNKYTGTKQEFDEERKRKCEGRILVCRQ